LIYTYFESPILQHFIAKIKNILNINDQ